MSKIIQRGTKQKVSKTIIYDVWETKCDRCGCVFEAKSGEFKHECGLETIICHQCGRYLDSYRWEYSKKKTKTKTVRVWEDEIQ